MDEGNVSKLDVDKLAVIATARDDGKLAVDVLVKLTEEKYAYQTTYKVSRELLDPAETVIDQFFDEVKKAMKSVLAGERELNAII